MKVSPNLFQILLEILKYNLKLNDYYNKMKYLIVYIAIKF